MSLKKSFITSGPGERASDSKLRVHGFDTHSVPCCVLELDTLMPKGTG